MANGVREDDSHSPSTGIALIFFFTNSGVTCILNSEAWQFDSSTICLPTALCSFDLSTNQLAVFFSHTKQHQPPVSLYYFFLITNQHQLIAAAKRTAGEELVELGGLKEDNYLAKKKRYIISIACCCYQVIGSSQVIYASRL